MVPRTADNRDPGSWASRLRAARFQRFLSCLGEWGFAPGDTRLRLVDIGGTAGYWQQHVPLVSEAGFRLDVTVVNLAAAGTDPGADIAYQCADARDLHGFADREFDIAYSNSVIEHVGTLHDQAAMAREVRRVSRTHFVQTPNRHFPLEPHSLVPGWQYLPVWLRVVLLRRHAIGWHPRTPDYLEARAAVEQVRLLTGREIQGLFPDSLILRERVLFLTKSFMAVSRAGSAGARAATAGPGRSG